MDDWNALFATHADSGVLRVGGDVDEGQIQIAATAAGLGFARIDLREAGDKPGILHAFAGALEFPDYFGMNWDALYDCLTDMSWSPAVGYVMLLTGFQRAADSAPEDLELLTRVLQSAADYWREREIRFYAVLAG
ncbi:MAG: barstar family protein [Dehalococcoidia bacterium]|nr:barstar family protein [Dehalococcoidia bacterium]